MALRKGWSGTTGISVLVAIGALMAIFIFWSSSNVKRDPGRTSGTVDSSLFAPTSSNGPSATGQELISRFAKDNGISDEQARQALRKGGRRAYSPEEVDRVFGK